MPLSQRRAGLQETAMSRVGMLRRTLVVATLAVLAGVIGAATAGAQGATIDVSPPAVAAGGSVTVSGLVPTTGDNSCPEADVATLTSDAALFAPDGFGPDLARDAAGAFQLTYVVDPATVAGV